MARIPLERYPPERFDGMGTNCDTNLNFNFHGSVVNKEVFGRYRDMSGRDLTIGGGGVS